MLPDLEAVFPTKFSQLEMLNLSKSGVTAWGQIQCVGACTTLKALKLCHNPIADIPEFAGLFPTLKQLNLEETNISSLHSLQHINCFPALTDLRINGTPLTQRFTDHSRMILISDLPHVVNLNGSKLNSKERLHSERNFVREFSLASGSEQHAELDASEDTNPMIRYLAAHELPVNRAVFQRLFTSHGQVYKFAEVNLAPPTDVMLHLQTEEGERSTATFPLQLKVKDLKATCEAMFGIPIANMKLFYGDHEMLQVMGLEVLRFDSKTLGSYNMKDDDIIVVARKDSVN